MTATVKTIAERSKTGAEAIAAMLSLDLKAVQDTLNPPPVDGGKGGVAPLPPGLAESAKVMASRGMTAVAIAQLLKVQVASVELALRPRDNSSGAGSSKDPLTADEIAYNEAIRASLAAELGHISRQVSFEMHI